MSWSEKMKEWGGADLLFLSEDGEFVEFIVVDEPILLESRYKGKVQERIGCPIVTGEGYVLFIIGKRLARRLSKHEGIMSTNSFIVARHGVSGDIDSKYELRISTDLEKTEQLFEIATKEFKPEMIVESIKQAIEVMSS